MNMIRIAALLLTAGMLGAPVAFAADSKDAPPPPVSAEPQTTSATYGDWILRCSRANDAQRVCEIALPFSIQGQQGLFAQLAVGRVGPKEPYKMTIIMAPNVSFPSSVKLSLDDKDTQPIDLSWRFCVAGGCRADADIKEDEVKRWRAQSTNAQLQFKDSSGREIKIPVSLRGFAQAMDALAKS